MPVPPKNKFAGIGCNVRFLNQERRAGRLPWPSSNRRKAEPPAVKDTEPVPRASLTVSAVISFLATLPAAEAQALVTVAGMMRRNGQVEVGS